MAEVSLDNAPRKARELFEKGFASMERGNLDYAMDMLTASLEIEPRLLQARRFLRAAAVRKFKESKGGAFSHFMANLTHSGTVMKVQALIKNKPDQALKTAEKLIRADPLNKNFINVLAKAAVAAEMPEVAIQMLEIAKDHYPQDAHFLDWLGNLYLETKQTQKGRLCFEDLIRLRPNDPKVIKSLKDAAALDTMHQGGWNEATSYRDVMKDSKEAVLLEQESKAVKSTKDLDDLIAETQQRIEREPDNVNYRRTLAELFSRAARFDEALGVLQDAQKTSGRADPQVDRAISTVRTKQFDHDIEQLQSAGDEAGAKARSAEKAAFILQDAGERVQRYPNDLQFRYELAVLYFEHNRLNEAIQELQLSQRNPQRRTRSLYYMALCFKLKQQYDIAMEQLEKAASELHVLDDTKKDILYEMGIISELMGNAEKAVQFFKEIYSVDILYKDVAQKIEKAYKK
jgi:tetratricopeptide (TPR) repeat protein